MNSKRKKRQEPNRTLIFFEAAKWLLFAVLLFVILRSAGSAKASGTPFAEVSGAVEGLVSAENTVADEGQLLRRYIGLDKNDFDGCLYLAPKTAMDVEELVLLKLSDPADEEETVKVLEDRIASQIGIFESYGVGQMAMLRQSFVLAKGGYVLYYTGSDPEAVRAAFLGVL